MKLALADLTATVEKLAETATDSTHPEYGQKALYTLDLIQQMLKAKGPAWTREWEWLRAQNQRW